MSETLTEIEFLKARVTEDEKDFAESDSDEWAATSADLNDGYIAWVNKRMRAECEAKRAIIKLHESWPVLVETPIDLAPEISFGADPQHAVFRVSKQIAWMTDREYRKRFGDEPPTAPMIHALSAIYADHSDYNPEWKL